MPFDVQAVRQQFPSLLQPAPDSDVLPIFFDNPAGTQVPRRVMDKVVDYYMQANANVGGPFLQSQRTEAIMQDARAVLADFLIANRPEEIVFGASMTALNFALSRAIAQHLEDDAEIVLTRMDHDANVAPWLAVARDRNLTVKWVEIQAEDGTLDMASLEGALSEKTRIVAAVHASNALGTINPVAQIAEMAHAVGAYYVMDAVQSAPHVPIDVQKIGCDFLLCSAYKFFGPHVGVMWGRHDLLEALPAYKVRPAKDATPYRWETGTPSFETISGTAEAIQYLGSLAEDASSEGIEGEAIEGYEGRQLQFKQGIHALQAHETALAAHLIAGLLAIPGVAVAGITDVERLPQRVSTVSFLVAGYTPAEVSIKLAEQHIHARAGDYYAVEAMQALGHGEHGMVRVGPVHYNTIEEIDRLLNVIDGL